MRARLASVLGPEPLSGEWSAHDLHGRLRHRQAPLKAALLDQRVVAGLGNIYVDEACALAHIRPDQPAARLTRGDCERLVDAVRLRLQEAIDVGGSTLRDYRGVAGEVGGMQERFAVYGRGGEHCLTCGATLREARIAGRTTVWCSSCQRLGRARS
jgi:formamidopyrimidine-DNA glycosylase